MTDGVTDLDDTDRRLLLLLSEDATRSAGQLGRMVGLSQPAAWRRVQRLYRSGAIRGRRLDLDAEKLGFGVTVFLGVKLATKGRVSLDDFEGPVAKFRGICARGKFASWAEVDAHRAEHERVAARFSNHGDSNFSLRACVYCGVGGMLC